MLLKVVEAGSAAPHRVWLLWGLQASRENKKFTGDYISLFICGLTKVQAAAEISYRSGENHLFLIKELAEYANIQAHFVAF